MTESQVQAQAEAPDRYALVVRSLHEQLQELTGVTLPLRLWTGETLGPEDDYRFVLTRPWSLRALLLTLSDLGAGEAYVRGDVEFEGDIIKALVAVERVGAAVPPRARMRLARALLALPRPPRDRPHPRAHLRGRVHTPERDREAIAFHYDLPKAFYEQFLDRALVYSCAYWADPEDTLDAAQERKLEMVCRKLRLQRHGRLLDIGCGFGSLLLHAAKYHGVRGLGVTLSETQATEARRRIEEAGLTDRVEVRLADYRTLSEEFDAVVSVGMVEHVGPSHLPQYYEEVAHLLREGGLSLTHVIVMGRGDGVTTGHDRSFAAKHVFPDGGLVPAWRHVREAETHRLHVVDLEQLRPHYALTLRRWVERLERNRTAAIAAADEPNYRVWRLYMAAAAARFELGHLGVVQLLASRGHPSLPLGRQWMLPP
jgi:cyclopropane-fatty-acyl-phospholipid synthase